MSPYCWHKLECGSNVKKKGEKAEEEEEEFKKKGRYLGQQGSRWGRGGGRGLEIRFKRERLSLFLISLRPILFFTKESCQRAKLSIQSFAIHSE